MPDEEALLKTTFIDRLAREKAERQSALVEAKAKKKKDRKDLLDLASLERFLSKKLDFRGNMNTLRELDTRELESIKKLVLSDAKRKSFWSGLGFLVGLFLPVPVLTPVINFIVSLLIGGILGATLVPFFLHYFWFVMTGHYLGFYCKDCIKKRGTSLLCHCESNY